MSNDPRTVALVQAELDRARAHEDRMFARLDRRNSRVNQANWREAWAERNALEDELRQMTARVRASRAA